jgi:hypothetical protein
MIKGAAVAGVAAWTAPVIIDSLASPAAALSAPVGCADVFTNGQCVTTNCNGTPCTSPLRGCPGGSTLCTTTTCCHAIEPCLGLATKPCQNGGTFTMLCNNCVFVDSIANTDNSGCFTPASSGGSFGSKTIVYGSAPASNYNQYAFRVNCT